MLFIKIKMISTNLIWYLIHCNNYNFLDEAIGVYARFFEYAPRHQA